MDKMDLSQKLTKIHHFGPVGRPMFESGSELGHADQVGRLGILDNLVQHIFQQYRYHS